MKITIIAAIGANNELGKDNQLLWHISSDLRRFKQRTTGHCIVMGRKTFESIGKALPNRTTIVITRNKNITLDGVVFVTSLRNAFVEARKRNENECFVIGGAQIYLQALPYADSLDITHVHESFDADVFFPAIPGKVFKQTETVNFTFDEVNRYNYSFTTYENQVKKNRALFLDRDGVLNQEIGAYITKLDELKINLSIVPLLKQKQKDGYLLIVITNQGAINKGVLTHVKLQELHEKLKSEFALQDVHFDEIYYCPHHSDLSNCLCRKPKALMLEKAIARFNININESVLIGDNERDLGAANAAGVLGIKIMPNETKNIIVPL